jgi:hypothetical protein
LDAGEEEELYPGEKSPLSPKSQLSPKEKKKAASFAKLSPEGKEAFQRTASVDHGHLRPALMGFWEYSPVQNDRSDFTQCQFTPVILHGVVSPEE